MTQANPIVQLSDGQIVRYADRIRTALTGLGFAFETKAGSKVEISWDALARSDDNTLACLSVDTKNLPRKVIAANLHTPKVMNHLSTVLGKKVRCLNSVGLTYVVFHQAEPAKKRWLKVVPLTVDVLEGYEYPWPLGITQDREPVCIDLKGTHILDGGQSGAGKTQVIHAGVYGLIYTHSPKTLQFAMIDMKRVELTRYTDIPHLIAPIAKDGESAARVIGKVHAELERRMILFDNARAENIDMYKKKTGEEMPLLVLIIDEVADLIATWGKDGKAYIELLNGITRLGRAFGISLVLSTQNPVATYVNTQIRANCNLRIALKVPSHEQSSTILGKTGAEKLPPTRGEHARKGRMLVDGARAGLTQLLGYYVTPAQSESLIKAITKDRRNQQVPKLPLTPVEIAMIVFARDKQNGKFDTRGVPAFVAGIEGGSTRQVKNLRKQWMVKGWLTEAKDRESAFCTPALLNFVSEFTFEQIEKMRNKLREKQPSTPVVENVMGT